MFDARPEDREQIALWIKNIEIDHRPGPDGNVIEDVRVTFGKKGTTNYELHYWKSRLAKENPMLAEKFGPAIEKWEKDQKIPTDGLPLEAWPAITKGQIKVCRDLGLRSVQDIATATDSIREKIGMGAADLMKKAKAFLENEKGSATANKVADLEGKLETLVGELNDARRTIDALMAEKGKTPRKPKMQEAA
jgi:hypothetical protein